MLFEEKQRTDVEYARRSDDAYSFYDKSAIPKFQKVRDMLNSWFEHYPGSSKSELKNDFIKKDFSAAFYELFIHELFRKQGFELIPHPDIKSTRKKPDFLAKGHGLEFYIEATLATGKSTCEVTQKKREDRFFDYLDDYCATDFILCLEKLVLKTEIEPSVKEIGNRINKECDALRQKLSTGTEYLQIVNHPFLYEDALIAFKATIIPADNKEGDQKLRSIGSEPIKTDLPYVPKLIRKSLETKATRYGELDKPLLVCVNATSIYGTTKDVIEDTLLGSLAYQISTKPGTCETFITRKYDGFFRNTIKGTFTKASAVMITTVWPANLHIADHWLVAHPYAKIPLDLSNLRISESIIDGGYLVRKSGKSINEVIQPPVIWE